MPPERIIFPQPQICHSAESNHVVLDLCPQLDWICEKAELTILWRRNDKFVAELNPLQLSSELTCTGIDKAKVGADIPLCPKKYASMGLKCIMKAPGASEEKLSALEAFVPPTHFVEWVGEPDYIRGGKRWVLELTKYTDEEKIAPKRKKK